MAKKQQIDLKGALKNLSSSLRPIEKLSTVEWIQKHDIRNEFGMKMDFTNRKFLIDFFNDQSPRQAIRASAQVGKTVGMYMKALKMGLEDDMSILFSEPTQEIRDDLVKTKLNPIIENNEYLRARVKGDISNKRVGNSNLFLKYTFGTAGGIAITADACFYDEVSRSNPHSIDMFKTRLLNSEYKYEYWISNPNTPDDLLDKKWKASNQKHWGFKCSRCNQWNMLNYDGLGYGGEMGRPNVCKERKIFVCNRCDEPLRIEDKTNGQWIERYTNRQDISGYWISQLNRHNCDVNELLMEEKKNKYMFENMFLGRPYAGSDVVVNASVIKKHLGDPSEVQQLNILGGGVVAGIDVGHATGHHVILMKDYKVFLIQTCDTLEDVENLLIKYNVDYATIDSMPEYEGAKNLQANLPNVVMRNRYLTNRSTRDEVITYDYTKGMVHSIRHIMFDNIINQINEGKFTFLFHSYDNALQTFCDHFGTLARIPDMDSAGNPTFKWDAPNHAADHYAHAFLYACVSQARKEEMTMTFGAYNASSLDKETVVDPENDFGFLLNEEDKKSWEDY